MNTNHIYTYVIATALLAAVGCADGQREKGTGKGKRMSRNSAWNGRGAALQKNGSTPSRQNSGKTQLPTAADADTAKTISDRVAELERGAPATDLKEMDLFKLVGWTTLFSAGGAAQQALRTTVFQADPLMNQAPEDTLSVGKLGSDRGGLTASIVIPLQLGYSSATGAQKQMTDRVLTTTTSERAGVIGLEDQLADGPADNSKVVANLTTLLINAKQTNQPVMTVGDKVTLEIKSITRPDPNHLRITLVLLDQNHGVISRTFYVTYASINVPRQPLRQSPESRSTSGAADAPSTPGASAAGTEANAPGATTPN